MSQSPTLLETGLSGRHALVLGAGESGLAMTEYLLRQGSRVRLVDSRPLGTLDLPETVECRLGEAEPFSAGLLEGVSLVLVSPGLSPHPNKSHSVADILAAARTQGIPVASELDLFEWALSGSLARPPVLAVTGTNGKTTTAMLTAHLLRSSGLDAQQAGNVSPSLLRALMDRLDQGRQPDAWVLELSSFQLALSQTFRPTASVILNVSEDHLDWHIDLADYAAAKRRVMGLPQPTGQVWINREESGLSRELREALAPWTQASKAKGAAPSVSLRSFGLGACPAGESGLGLLTDGLDWLTVWPPADGKAEDVPAPRRLMPAAALRIAGRHNLQNAMAALGLAMAVQPDLAAMLHGLRSYLGEPHRLQTIAELDGIAFVDDSKGTNVGATVAALRGEDLPVAVILGGDGKGQSFEPLVDALVARQAIAVCLGRDGPAIAGFCRNRGLQTIEVETMVEAVEQATAALKARLSGARGQVLLSPACASLDMFRNYAHRAEVFGAAVAALCERAGMPS